MKGYKIHLRATGSLTQLPDSQKLFGALVYMFAEKYGSERASMLTQSILEKRIHLALSNVMPLGYLPVPQDYLVDWISTGKDVQSNGGAKKSRTAIKDRSYIRHTELDRILENPAACEEEYPYIKLQNRQQLRASIDSERYDIPELDSKLYSVPIVEIWEVEKRCGDDEDKEIRKPVKNFYFYLQGDGCEICAELLAMLQEAVSARRRIILGKRASQGLNTFELQEMEEEDLPHPPGKCYLNMGMLLPDKIDFESSALKLFTSERRSFEVAEGWDKDFPRYFISYIAEGSILSLTGEVEEAGKSIRSPFHEKRDIVFGNAFLYALKKG